MFEIMEWCLDHIVMPFLTLVLLIGIGVFICFAVAGIATLYQHRNDPPRPPVVNYSLPMNEWVCTQTHTESYGKGQHRDVCDQYVRVERK